MTLRDITMTNEAFFEFVNRPENATKRFELLNGVIYQMPSPSVLHNWIVSQLHFFFMLFLLESRLGRVFGDNTDFVLVPGYVLQPDLSFVFANRVDVTRKYFEGAPDIAVEVISPSNTPYDIANKIEAYLQYGARMVITVSPDEKLVRVYTPTIEGYAVKLLNVDDTLKGGDVLPGFSIPVRDIFPPEEGAPKHDQPNA